MQPNKDLWVRFIKSKLAIGKIAIGIFILVGFLFGYWHFLSYQNFLINPIKLPNNQTTIHIKSGDSINLLTRQWTKQGIIENPYYLRLLVFLRPELHRIQKGEYAISENETPLTLLTKLSLGKVIQYPFTIIEGMNRYDIIELVANNPLLINDLDSAAKSLGIHIQHKDEQLKLLKADLEIEGWLYPDTYYFSKNEQASKLLQRALQKMQTVLSEQWHLRAENLPYQSPYDALIMASIIEKETGLHSEREKIAGVFVRRLNKKMRLGTDPTVIYGIGPSFNGDITYKDLKTPTPYNTYLIKGLPPTPIAMPSEASIYAALHPDDSNALYFVADGSGGHYFSSTLKEHNKAVDRYIRNKP